jgi:hypothetical protein
MTTPLVPADDARFTADRPGPPVTGGKGRATRRQQLA